MIFKRDNLAINMQIVDWLIDVVSKINYLDQNIPILQAKFVIAPIFRLFSHKNL